MTRKASQQIPLNEITSNIPIPWNEIIAQLLSRPLKFPRKPTDGELALIWLRVKAWEIALHWVIKGEWNTKHKIPGPRVIVNNYKLKGEFLRNILRLCERCHTMQEALPPGAVPYPHAAYWFGLVFWELILHEIGSALTLQERQKQPRQVKTSRKKEAVLQERMDEAMALQVDYKNPLTEDSGFEATFRLMKTATVLAQQSNVFHNKYWRPFLNSYKSETQEMSKKGWGRITLENNKAYVQVDKGRNRRHISPPDHWKKMIFTIVSQ